MTSVVPFSGAPTTIALPLVSAPNGLLYTLTVVPLAFLKVLFGVASYVAFNGAVDGYSATLYLNYSYFVCSALLTS